MTGRSRTGCLTCRQRKLKCDEARPICGQCQKASRTCIPSTGIVFRHQQNASMNQSDGEDSDSLKGFYAYKNTFGKDSVWVDVPKRVTFIVNADPYAEIEPDMVEPGIPQNCDYFSPQPTSSPNWPLGPHGHAHGLEALSAAATSNHYHYLPSVVDSQSSTSREASVQPSDIMGAPSPRAAMASPMSSAGPLPSNNLDRILNHSSAMSPPRDRFPSHSSAMSPPIGAGLDRHTLSSHHIIQNVEVERSHEIGFLLRHFAEVPGHFMDLFDRESYFSLCIPVKAITNPLLKHSAAAYAAKQLTRVKGRKSVYGGAASTQSYMELYPMSTQVNWAYKAAQHYDKAISLLMDSIKDDGTGVARAESEALETWRVPMPFEVEELSRGEKRKAMRDIGSPGSLISNESSSHVSNPKKKRKVSVGREYSDEMAAAAVMLCDYEFLEAPGSAWSKHLNGTKSLLDIVQTSVMPLHPPGQAPRSGFSRARQATFWDFARQDYLAAFINETQTRLDTEDLPLWKEAGLLLDDEGFVTPSNTTASGHAEENSGVMKADMISNAMVWLGGKIVNYAAAADTGPEGREAWEGINQATIQLRWNELQKQLDVWHMGLPDTFEPCVEMDPRELPPQHRVRDSVFPEVWFNDLMAASTMQHYHMAQMLLKTNQPQQSTIGRTPFHKRLGSYKSIAADVEQHARAICGIACSRPTGSVRVHSVQPLFLAGQCLEKPAERTELVRLLRAIEADTGWATEYRVKQLLQCWDE